MLSNYYVPRDDDTNTKMRVLPYREGKERRRVKQVKRKRQMRKGREEEMR